MRAIPLRAYPSRTTALVPAHEPPVLMRNTHWKAHLDLERAVSITEPFLSGFVLECDDDEGRGAEAGRRALAAFPSRRTVRPQVCPRPR